MLLPNRTAYSRTFLISFSVLDFHCIVPLLVDGHSSLTMLLSDSGIIRCHLTCPSPSDGHDVLCLSVGLSCILLFVSVTELLPLAKFSRHAKAQTSLTLVIWLNENILIPTSSLMTFPDEVSTITFSAVKSLDERSGKAEWVRAVFCKYKMDEGLLRLTFHLCYLP